MSDDNTGNALPPHVQVIQMATSLWISQAIYACAKLGLPDLMQSGPRDASEMARETEADPKSVYRLLRFLASLGYFTEVEKGTFENKELGAALCSDHPGMARSTTLAFASPAGWKAWGEFLHSVKTGETAFEKANGEGIFDYFSKNPQEAAWFNDAMIGFHGAEPPEVAKVYDSSDVKRLVDVGGGSGNLLTTILKAHPHIEGTLFDLPHVTEAARARIEELGLSDRCRVVSGSFFEELPPGDAYTLSHIIHDWDEDECLTILGNCKKASPEAKVQIIETVIPEGDTPHQGKLQDIVMLALPGGEERTEAEYADLLSKAGYRLDRVIPTGSAVSIIEGVPA